MSVRARRDSVRALLPSSVDSMLVTRPSNVRYLTGFTGSVGSLILGSTDRLIVDARYEKQVHDQVTDMSIEVVDSSAKLWPATTRAVAGTNVAVEGQFLTVGLFDQVADVATAIATDGLVEQIRAIKEPAELDALRDAVRRTDAALEALLSDISPGQTEYQLAGYVELRQYESGGEMSASPIIVCSGPRTALPHGLPSERVINSGEPLMIDLGTAVDGYRADTTRTFHVGPAPSEFREIYEVVLTAQRAACDAVRPGLRGREIDAVGRDIIEEAGYGWAFGHSLGHSLGLDYHERPLFGPLDETVIEPGMVMTVEPGIYLPDRFGVRIEDQVIVTEDGCDNLTGFTRELIEL